MSIVDRLGLFFSFGSCSRRSCIELRRCAVDVALHLVDSSIVAVSATVAAGEVSVDDGVALYEGRSVPDETLE